MDQFHQIIGKVGETQVTAYTVSTASGLSFTATSYGATILDVSFPDKDNKIENITLNYPSLYELIENRGPYYGCIAGRVANRIKDGTFHLDGIDYNLAVNNGPNSLHGGTVGFDQKIWDARFFKTDTSAGVEFIYISEDGEENYPGKLEVTIRYELTSKNEMIIIYEAVTDKATPVNLTNHTYWNLSGGCKSPIYNHTLCLSCCEYLPTTSTQIPTGELRPVEQDPLFDFTTARPLRDAVLGIGADAARRGEGRAGLDHCFVVDGALDKASSSVTSTSPSADSAVGSISSLPPPAAAASQVYRYNAREQKALNTRADSSAGGPKSLSLLSQLANSSSNNSGVSSTSSGSSYLRHVATLTDPESGRRLDLHATQPGVQVYSANWLAKPTESAETAIPGIIDATDTSASAGDDENRSISKSGANADTIPMNAGGAGAGAGTGDLKACPDFPYVMHNGLCLETQHFPDAVNQSPSNPLFPSVVLRPDELYFHQAVFTFSCIR